MMHTFNIQQTSIRISSNLLNVLKSFKEKGESYEEIIRDSIEPHLELSDEAKKYIEISKKEIERRETFTLKEIQKELGL